MSAFAHSIPCIRLGEFDLGGVLYHANYFHLYELAREALLLAEGLPYSELVERGEHLAITESRQEFLRPIRYGQPVTIELTFSTIRRVSFSADYAIFTSCSSQADSASRSVVHRASTTHVLVQSTKDTFRPGKLPEQLLSIVSRYPTAVTSSPATDSTPRGVRK